MNIDSLCEQVGLGKVESVNGGNMPQECLLGLASVMDTAHIIIGPNGMCKCGAYAGRDGGVVNVRCRDIIAYALAMQKEYGTNGARNVSDEIGS